MIDDLRADLALAQARPLIVSPSLIKVLDGNASCADPALPAALGMQSCVRDDVRSSTFLLSRLDRPNEAWKRVGRGVDSRYRRVCRISDVSYTFLCTAYPRVLYGHIFSLLLC